MQIVREPGVRPPLLPFELDLELEGYTLINYAVPVARIRAMVPDSLTLATTEVNGRPTAWLSIFIGRNVLRRIGAMPALPLQFNQVNYRTYVEGPQGRRLYIFRSLIGPGLMAYGARLLPQLQAEPQPFYFAPEIVSGELVGMEAEVGEAGRELTVRVESAQDDPWTPGFATPEAAVDFLANVPEALFPLPDGRFGQLLAPHPPLAPTGGRLACARLHWLAEHQVLAVNEIAFPASIFLQARADFPTSM